MEIINSIKYDGKTYPVTEPTIEVWTNIMASAELDTDIDLAVRVISWITGLEEEEIEKADARSVLSTSEGIINYYLTQSKEFYKEFEFNGKNYKFIDLKAMTFGEFIDIDDILGKPDSVRRGKLHELLALLYREVDDKGKYLDYDIERISNTAEEFKKLPIKYLNGVLVFFYTIRNTLERNTRLSLERRERVLRLKMKLKNLLTGAGIKSSFFWLTSSSIKWITLLKRTISKYLISSRINSTSTLNAKGK